MNLGQFNQVADYLIRTFKQEFSRILKVCSVSNGSAEIQVKLKKIVNDEYEEFKIIDEHRLNYLADGQFELRLSVQRSTPSGHRNNRMSEFFYQSKDNKGFRPNSLFPGFIAI